MTKLPYIVTAVAIALAGLFALLNRFWSGFVYFVLVSLLLLSVFWGVWFILKYFTDFKAELEEKFAYFKAEKLNGGNLTAEHFEANLPYFKKQFKKRVLKDKLIKWFQILFCFALAVTFLIAMVLI